MSLAFIPVYIRYLGIEAYGLIGLFAVLQAWLTLLDLGMKPTLSREMARFIGGAHTETGIRDLLRSIEIVAVIIAIIIILGIGAASGWLAKDWLRAEDLPIDVVTQAFTILGAVTALRFIEGVYSSCIVGLQRQVQYNLINSSMATLRGLGAVGILMFVSPTVAAFFIWQGIVSLLTLGLLAIVTYANLPSGVRTGQFSVHALRDVGHFAAGMLGITFLSLLLTQVDKVILSNLLPLSEYGFYTLTSVVAGGLYLLTGPITQAWFPRLSELYANKKENELIAVFHLGAQLVSAVVGSCAIILIFFSETILRIWSQDEELAHQSSVLLSLLALGNLFNCLMWIPYQTQLAFGWTGLTTRTNIIAVALIVPAILWITPRYGAVGAACVWVFLNAGYVLISIQFMHRKILITEKWRWYKQDLLQPLLVAFTVASFFAWGAPSSISNAVQSVWILLAGASTLLASVVAAPLLRTAMFTQIRKYFKSNCSQSSNL